MRGSYASVVGFIVRGYKCQIGCREALAIMSIGGGVWVLSLRRRIPLQEVKVRRGTGLALT